jgi:two-component system chemotaxis response regulator CheY
MARILITDDAMFMRRMLADLLVEAGHEVVGEAGSGKEALQLYQVLKPDIVTLDVVMPGESGVEAARAILALDPQARILMVSSISQQETVGEALKAGARAYIIKPFNPEEVRQRIAEVVSR